MVGVDVDLKEGEILVGVTVEEDHRILRCIGFTFLTPGTAPVRPQAEEHKGPSAAAS